MQHRIRLQGFKASRLPLTESEGKPYAEKKRMQGVQEKKSDAGNSFPTEDAAQNPFRG
jgi:hypothetical protein